ncbi:unnamed protein product, partial [Cyprideis torosa]
VGLITTPWPSVVKGETDDDGDSDVVMWTSSSPPEIDASLYEKVNNARMEGVGFGMALIVMIILVCGCLRKGCDKVCCERKNRARMDVEMNVMG